MKIQARKLVVVNIEDLHPLDRNTFREFVEIITIESETDIQIIARDNRISGRRFVADIFAVDVNMCEMDIPAGLKWDAPADLRPLGPIMALPFLMSGECTAFVPYSNFWKDLAVKQNGYVLLALSVILAARDDRIYTLDEVRESLEKELQSDANEYGESLFLAARQAMIDGIEQYRKRLKEMIAQGKVSVLDMGEKNRLAEFEEAHEDGRYPLPFADDDGPLCLSIRWPSAREDHLELSSLFADKLLRPGHDVKTVIGEINKELWTMSKDRANESEIFTIATQALELAEDASDTEEYILHIVERLLPEVKDLSDDAMWRLRRIVTEFAWVRAWHETREGQRNKAVHEYLGLRAPKGSMKKDPGKKCLNFVCGSYTVVDNHRWRRAFKRDWESPTDAYSLDRNEHSCLTPTERHLCRRYAEEVLGWDGRLKPYPAWMLRSWHE